MVAVVVAVAVAAVVVAVVAAVALVTPAARGGWWGWAPPPSTATTARLCVRLCLLRGVPQGSFQPSPDTKLLKFSSHNINEPSATPIRCFSFC